MPIEVPIILTYVFFSKPVREIKETTMIATDDMIVRSDGGAPLTMLGIRKNKSVTNVKSNPNAARNPDFPPTATNKPTNKIAIKYIAVARS